MNYVLTSQTGKEIRERLMKTHGLKNPTDESGILQSAGQYKSREAFCVWGLSKNRRNHNNANCKMFGFAQDAKWPLSSKRKRAKYSVAFLQKLKGFLGKKSGGAAMQRESEVGGKEENKFINTNQRPWRVQNREIKRRRDFNGNGIELANKTNMINLLTGGFLRLRTAGIDNRRRPAAGRSMAVGIFSDEPHQQHDGDQAGGGEAFEIVMHGKTPWVYTTMRVN